MRQMRRFSSAVLLATMLAGAMVISTTTLEASKGGKKPSTVCAYLKSVIDYEFTSPYIKAWAISLYNYYECEPAL